MKEILYIQAGPAANYVGSHFWNTQESYFTYDEDIDPLVVHDRSFREGLTNKGEPTFCPRVLVFDRKSHFGALSDELYGTATESNVTQWDAGVVQCRQDPIPKSVYQTRLDEGRLEEDEDEIPGAQDISDVRFWSDYSRVYYHPRSAQKLPDPPEWERTDGEWTASREAFDKHEQDNELMENDVRFFMEECDAPQGVQLLTDCGSFGGFTDAFLIALRDEYSKLPSLAFPMLSGASNVPVHVDEEQNVTKALNDALCIQSLDSLSTINVPLQHPSTWPRGKWLEGLNIDLHSQYHTSALLATHIESITLPLRLKDSPHDIASLSSLLNPSGSMSFSHLSGMYPVPSPTVWSAETDARIFDLSAVTDVSLKNQTRVTEYARLHVSRGFASAELSRYDAFFATKTPEPFSIHAPAYPTPSSFPPFFAASPAYPRSNTDSHRAFSALTTSSAISPQLAVYATLAQECVDRRAGVVVRMSLEYDEVRELKDDLWALCDRYAGEEGWREGEDAVALGEDEEY
ncbi:tubulin nucleotide-binding domain-like protein [Trametes gibbosa]|nr:tubulin nucleotide-binding domain-like protein [Trametes gibbosa]